MGVMPMIPIRLLTTDGSACPCEEHAFRMRPCKGRPRVYSPTHRFLRNRRPSLSGMSHVPLHFRDSLQ
eukprot:scaffold48963_cov18-Tisochrysis_lutea.AAC.1